MRKKLIFILPLVLIFQIVFSACGSGETGGTSDGETEDIINEAENTTVDVLTETESARYAANVPDSDFGGAPFRVLGIDPLSYPDYCAEFDAEQETGDILNDAIYRRNRSIEEKYNVKFETASLSHYDDTFTEIKKFVAAGSDEYEMVMLITRNAFSAALDGLLTPIDDIPHLDLSQPWYRSAVNNQFSMGGKKFLAFSDECLNMYGFTTSILFNKAFISNYGLDNPYTLVREGKWTWDKFYETAATVITDLNGDGVYNEEDVTGIIGETDTFFPPVWMGSNLFLVEKNEEDIPVFSAPGNERLLGIFEKLIGWLGTDGFFTNSFTVYGAAEASRAKGSELFSSGHSMFKIGRVTDVLVLRSMDTDFGILPLPKYDEAQENYVSRMEDAWLHVVPASNSNLEMTGLIMEVLAAESKNEVIPAFIDVALQTKYSRDEESVETLDILFNSVTVDIGDVIWFATVRGPICDQLAAKNNAMASALERMTNQVDALIEKAVIAAE